MYLSFQQSSSSCSLCDHLIQPANHPSIPCKKRGWRRKGEINNYTVRTNQAQKRNADQVTSHNDTSQDWRNKISRRRHLRHSTLSWMWHSLSCLAMNRVNSLLINMGKTSTRWSFPPFTLLEDSSTRWRNPSLLSEWVEWIPSTRWRNPSLPFEWVEWISSTRWRNHMLSLRKTLQPVGTFTMGSQWNLSTDWSFLHIITLYTMRMASAIIALIRKPLINKLITC